MSHHDTEILSYGKLLGDNKRNIYEDKNLGPDGYQEGKNSLKKEI